MDTKLKEAVERVRAYLLARDVQGADPAYIHSINLGEPDAAMLCVDDLRALVGAVGRMADLQRGLDHSNALVCSHSLALLWVLMHHQGINSRIGQGVRQELVIPPHHDMTEDQLAAAKMFEARLPPVFRNDGQEPDWKAYAAAEAEAQATPEGGQDERAAFEVWQRKTQGFLYTEEAEQGTPQEDRWIAWQARAALAASQQAQQ
jgi:hypothetical protein